MMILAHLFLRLAATVALASAAAFAPPPPRQGASTSSRIAYGYGSSSSASKSSSAALQLQARTDPLAVANLENATATDTAVLDLTPVAFGSPPESLQYDATTTQSSSSPSIQAVQLPLYQLMAAGSCATVLADMSMHPMDCMKTLQQSDTGAGLSLVTAAQYLWTSSGVAGFYHGFLTYATTDAAGGALKFAVWEVWKQKTVDKQPACAYLWAGAALAFLASSVLIVPGEFIKQQLQMSHYDGLLPAVQGVYSQAGLAGFFVGYDGVFYRDVPYTILELGLYEVLKGQLNTRRRSQQVTAGDQQGQYDDTWQEEILAAAITGAVTAVLTTPLDTVKTKMMVDDYGGYDFLQCFAVTVENHGWPAVFAGVLARVAWIVPFTAIYLPTYDYLKRQLVLRQAATLTAMPEE